MAARAQEDAKRRRASRLLLVVFFVFLVIIIVDQVAIFSWLVFFVFFVFFVFVVFFIRVIGDESQVDAVRLRDLELGFALRTAQDLALFDFVFVDIDFGGTSRATDHGSPPRTVVCTVVGTVLVPP